ncbi:hypothetical protein MN608_07617 [Microdochium nivale]|nr:hypothetical protein MN608_07617 [Microdochium nivale]
MDICRLPDPDAKYKVELPGNCSARPRTRFGSGSASVWAYPSAGGVVYGSLTAVQLKQLGLSNAEEANRSDNDEEEDRLGAAMLQLGADWWPRWGLCLQHSERIRSFPYDFHFPPHIFVAYPASRQGIWVLKCSQDRDWSTFSDENLEYNFKPSLPGVPDGFESHRMVVGACILSVFCIHCHLFYIENILLLV